MIKVFLILTILSPALLLAQEAEEKLTRKQVEELVEGLAEKMKVDTDVGLVYGRDSNDIFTTVRLLRLLRTSQAKDDVNVQKAMDLLESKLDGFLITFITYPESEKNKKWHKGIMLSLNQARRYREEYPRDYPDNGIASAVKKVFAYAQAAEQEHKAQPKGPPDR